MYAKTGWKQLKVRTGERPKIGRLINVFPELILEDDHGEYGTAACDGAGTARDGVRDNSHTKLSASFTASENSEYRLRSKLTSLTGTDIKAIVPASA